MQKVILIVLSIAVLCGSGQQVKCIVNTKYFIPNFLANWFKATEYCNYLGMRLAIVPDADTQSKVVEMIKSTDKFNNLTTEVWIGGSDLAQESFFYWHATGLPVQYTNWRDKQPDNAGKVEHCLEIRYIPAHGWNWHWNDRECIGKRYFVCENLEPGKEIDHF